MQIVRPFNGFFGILPFFEMRPGQKQRGEGFHVLNLAALGHRDGLGKRQPKWFNKFIGIGLSRGAMEIAGDENVDALVAVSNARVKHPDVDQIVGAPTGFLGEFASRRGFGIRAVEFARGYFDKHLLRRISKLADQ